MCPSLTKECNGVLTLTVLHIIWSPCLRSVWSVRHTRLNAGCLNFTETNTVVIKVLTVLLYNFTLNLLKCRPIILTFKLVMVEICNSLLFYLFTFLTLGLNKPIVYTWYICITINIIHLAVKESYIVTLSMTFDYSRL